MSTSDTNRSKRLRGHQEINSIAETSKSQRLEGAKDNPITLNKAQELKR